MVETEKLEIIIEKCHIIKKFAPLPDSVLGYYTYENGYYIILINECIKNDEVLYRTVLAEEIGHYRTTIGDITPRRYMCYKDRLEIDKKELAALKWATDFLIPDEMLLDEIKNVVAPSLSDLSDLFNVTQDFFMRKLEFMSKQKQLWELGDNKLLCLYNLPSVFVYTKMI